jgi:hypothetical protein
MFILLLIVIFVSYSIDCSIDGSDTELRAGGSRVLLPMGVIFFSAPYSSNRTMPPGFTQPVT